MRLPVECRLNGEGLFPMILFFSLLVISFDRIRYVFFFPFMLYCLSLYSSASGALALSSFIAPIRRNLSLLSQLHIASTHFSDKDNA